jgi:hypothetical protein
VVGSSGYAGFKQKSRRSTPMRNRRVEIIVSGELIGIQVGR